MNTRAQKILIILLIILALAALGYSLYKHKIGSISIPSTSGTVVQNQNAGEAVSFLTVPEGMKATYFAKDVPDARVIEIDPKGRLLVSETSEGKVVSLEDKDSNGVSDKQTVIATGLNKPHGLAMKCDSETGKCFLYVAEQNALERYAYDDYVPSLSAKTKVMDISASSSDRHFTRSLEFLPAPDDDILLVSVGSSCDVCNDTGDHASVISYNTKTGEKSVYAKGLRNATYMTLDPVSGKVFASEMGRDTLGDDIPPDEINIIERDKNYGWPNCYGQNIHDDKYDHNTYIRNPCMAPFETPAFIDLQAHSAPLGLGFIPEEGWPESYWYNLLVAYHGSWNRSVPTGYKIERLKMDSKGNYLGAEDFITGWLTPDGKKLGRPAGIKVLSGGVMYIADDLSGVIYRVSNISK